MMSYERITPVTFSTRITCDLSLMIVTVNDDDDDEEKQAVIIFWKIVFFFSNLKTPPIN